eukprot:GSChrysophyteH1.ASY1.ANO1.361.1 assembled CDS
MACIYLLIYSALLHSFALFGVFIVLPLHGDFAFANL